MKGPPANPVVPLSANWLAASAKVVAQSQTPVPGAVQIEPTAVVSRDRDDAADAVTNAWSRNQKESVSRHHRVVEVPEIFCNDPSGWLASSGMSIALDRWGWRLGGVQQNGRWGVVRFILEAIGIEVVQVKEAGWW